MKKNWLKKALCVGLAAVMTAGLCACGGGGGKVAQDPALAKQYVYSCQDFKLPDMGEDYNITSMTKIDDRIYMVVYVYHWKEDGVDDDMRLLSLSEDGSDIQEIRLEMPKQDSADGADQADEPGAQDPAAGTGAAVPEPRAAAASSVAAEPGMAASDSAAAEPETEDSEAEDSVLPEGGEGEIVSDEEWIDEPIQQVYEYTSYSRYNFSDSGILYAIKNHSLEDSTDPGKYVRRTDVSVCAWDLDGKLLYEEPLELLSGDNSDSAYLQAAVAASDGTFLMLTYNWDTNEVYQMTADREGNVKVGDKPMQDEEGVFVNLSSACAGLNNQIYFFYYDESDDYSTHIAAYDIGSNSFVGENIKLPSSLYYGGYRSVATGVGCDLLFSAYDGIYAYNMGDTEVTQLMSFVNSDLDTNSMYQFLALDEDRIMGFYYDRMNYETVGGVFTKVDPENIPDKQVIVIAGESLGYDVLHRVVEYNRSSDEYRIVTKTYEAYIQPGDYTAGYDQLSADILAGNMPDILYVDWNTDIEKYITKGLLADVGKLIENDEELSQAAFMENVFNAYRRNGKLYQVIPGFSVSTVVGKRSVVGDRTTWTMKDFTDLMASMPEGTQGFGEMTRSDFLNQAFYFCGKDFVNVEKGKCSFDSENFIAVLEYAATLPEEIDWENIDSSYWESYETLYRTDQILLTTMGISDAQSIVNTIGGTFGEDISYVGFPTDSGQGSYVRTNSSYVLSAKSANLDGAWDFVRYYLSEEYQKDMNWPLPIREDECMARLAQGLEKPYWEDENGEKVEYEYTYWINGEDLILDPLSQEQLDQLAGFVKSVDKAQYYNEDIWNIVLEEAEAFFSGQKSAKDVAGIIQNRAQVYVNENS